jgi:Uncharacterized protein conserved in bacteria (DUF2188)
VTIRRLFGNIISCFQFTEGATMAGKNQHVVRRDDQWAVRGAGNSRDTSLHRTQAAAERAARDIAINQKSEVVIHGENGRIRARNSYGNDPFPPKG